MNALYDILADINVDTNHIKLLLISTRKYLDKNKKTRNGECEIWNTNIDSIGPNATVAQPIELTTVISFRFKNS